LEKVSAQPTDEDQPQRPALVILSLTHLFGFRRIQAPRAAFNNPSSYYSNAPPA